ncbi:CHAT domain-containing protein [Streptomyces scopuliridis]|uniref:CHAT domain-containing protein n=1 Tax=Streptomyces scopuliridis TaxID=452529 RepID=A0ACD4ZJH2_9ACTN|nr:CHAT domain-containing protein [Streptomyces scopuliridis]WSB98634.1 CHAT domain-containing protein [Streptomyces scopuliridis]WSC07663.1 CHAT domain-containing protein [Streptomyces scopuliridis]
MSEDEFPDVSQLSDDELRASRDELLASAARAAGDDPELPYMWGWAGEWSFHLHLRQGREDDLGRAADALPRAFSARAARAARDEDGEDGEEIWYAWRVLYGQVLLCQYDQQPAPALLDRAEEELTAGLAGLPDTSPFAAGNAPLARLLLARTSAARYRGAAQDDPGRADLLAAAVRRQQDALGDQAAGSEEATELHGCLGDLTFEQGDFGVSVEHFRTALAEAAPGADVPLLRYGLATSLLMGGRAAADRELLREARNEFVRALAEARERRRQQQGATDAEEPWWAWQARARSVFVRAVLRFNWHEREQLAPAVAELHALLAEPGAEERLSPVFADAFGRLLYDHAAEQDDDTARDRAIPLLRRAVREWRPARDGDPVPGAMLLASLQQARYQDDQVPARLADIEDCARRVLAIEEAEADPGLRRMAKLMLAWVRTQAAPPTPSGPADDPDGVLDEGREAVREMMADFSHGRSFLDFDDDAYGAMANDVASTDRLSRTFDQLYEQWRSRDPESDEYGVFAGYLLSVVPMLDPHSNHITEEQKTALIEAARARRPENAGWQSTVHGAAGYVRLHDELAGAGTGLDEAIADLDRARTSLSESREAGGASGEAGAGNASGPGDTQRDLDDSFSLLRSFATNQRGQLRGAVDDLDSAWAAWERLRDSPSITPYMRRVMDGQQAGFAANRAALSGDLAGVDRGRAKLAALHAEMDPEDPSRIEVWTLLENVHSQRDQLADRLGAPPVPPSPGRPSTAELRRLAAKLPRDHHAWVLGDNGIARSVRAGARGDAQGVRESLALVEEALALVDEGSDDWLRYANVVGTSLCGLAHAGRDRRDLDSGIDWLERAAARTGGPEHRLYGALGLTLGRAYRLRSAPGRDDRRTGRRTGLKALRGWTWAALLQSGTSHAAEVAANATQAALEVASWCLEDNVPDEAVQALDSCRGLVLHTATTSRSVPERLAAAGRRDLADEWRAAGGTDVLPGAGAGPLPETGPSGPSADAAQAAVPSELRRRVLAVLTGPDETGQPQDLLLEPPSPARIGEALTAVRADYLVYLVPGYETRPGAAVVVTATGRVGSLPLPLLREDAAPLRAYDPTPLAARDMGPVPDGGGPYGGDAHTTAARTPRKQLDRLCGWAWYAAMKPLLEGLGVGEVPGEPPPTFVLVPMGALGVVPWHAAWESLAAGGRRYAVEAAGISYAASARLFCEVAGRPAVPHRGAALVVGNPTGDLRYAGEEADAVRHAFYPAGRFLGRGLATPDEVTAWLRDPANTGGVLHLACHGTVAANRRHSAYLSLYGGELAAEELTEAAAGAGRGELELVVLAACRSHVSGRGHNEAYSLATAFLVAGARSVVGSLWPVPDDATSLLMFMTHHYLRAEDLSPGAALRRAQLWMLDPARVLPSAMPDALALRAGALTPDDLTAWAGFTHLGR